MYKTTVDVLIKLFILLIILYTLIATALALVQGVYYRNVMKITARVDDINDTIISYAQKNGGINASTPGFQYANVDELASDLIQQHKLSGKILTREQIKITQTEEPGLRGSLVRVETSYSIPVFKIKGIIGRVVYVPAEPRVAEGIVHKYNKN